MQTKYELNPDFLQLGLVATEISTVAGDHRQTGRLLLASAANGPVPDRASLIGYLQNSGFIGPLLGDLEGCSFQVGDSFLQLVTFMGCSPHIVLEPPPHGGSFCYVRIDGPWPEPLLRYGRNTNAPRCCSCRNRINDWRNQLPTWLEKPNAMRVECAQCGHRQSPLNLSWRRDGGFGRLFIVVEDIFPGEAIPVPTLISGLTGVSNNSWYYFYVRD